MPICAVVDAISKQVINTIVADPEKDAPPHGAILVLVEVDDRKGTHVSTRWEYDTNDGTVKPSPALQRELDDAQRQESAEVKPRA